MKNLKLMTLNLWCYFDWDNRVSNIDTLIENESPDIVAFQEVQINTQFTSEPSSRTLTRHKYPYHLYEPAWGVTEFMPYDEHSMSRQSHGLAIASRYPILSHEVIRLTQHEGREEPAIALLCKLAIDGTETYVCNVHFDNTDPTSEAHLKELMGYLAERHTEPIMLGDFNNFNLTKFSSSVLKDYTISTEISEYTSIPKNNGTLDYIVVPKPGVIESVRCPEIYVSDHRPVVATIRINQS
jgi:endonuclease/exonuclease/phosphatase family metal-dependent hydrolase